MGLYLYETQQCNGQNNNVFWVILIIVKIAESLDRLLSGPVLRRGFVGQQRSLQFNNILKHVSVAIQRNFICCIYKNDL